MSYVLLTAHEIQVMLGLNTPKAAERLMDKWSVPFIHLGLGRGLGRRWSQERVVAAIKQREKDPAEAYKQKAKKKESTSGFFNLSVKEMVSLTRPAKRASFSDGNNSQKG